MMIDNGPETVQLYPAVRVTTDRGNIDRQPGSTPVPLEGVWIFPADSTEATAQGQKLRTRYTLRCRDFPAGAWSKIVWDGDDYDVIGDPQHMPGPARLEHWLVTLQARKPKAVAGG